MRPYRSFFAFMDFIGSLWVRISPYLSLWVLIGPYNTFYIRMESNVSLRVFIGPYLSLRIVMVLMDPLRFLCVFIDSNES